MPQKAIAFCRSQIFTTEPASPKIGCTPEGPETIDNAQKCFSHALHFLERDHFVGINRPFDSDAASTVLQNGRDVHRFSIFPLPSIYIYLFNIHLFPMTFAYVYPIHVYLYSTP